MQDFIVVFPGQGSQSAGMLNDVIKRPEVAHTLEEASTVLGYDIAAVIADEDDSRLNQTEYTQPAMLVADIALWRVWGALNGPMPAVFAGHSLGEYAALVAAESISFADALAVVQGRAKWMAEAVPQGIGAMAAIVGLSDEDVLTLCKTVSERCEQVVQAVNFNAPGQVVIAGHSKAVQDALIEAKAAGAKMARVIPVSVPAHSSLISPVVEKLAAVLADCSIQISKTAVIQNVDAAVATTSAGIAENLARQPAEPVRWVETMQNAYDLGAKMTIEIGPGRVLSGLSKRINKQIPQVACNSVAAMQTAIEKTQGSTSE